MALLPVGPCCRCFLARWDALRCDRLDGVFVTVGIDDDGSSSGVIANDHDEAVLLHGGVERWYWKLLWDWDRNDAVVAGNGDTSDETLRSWSISIVIAADVAMMEMPFLLTTDGVAHLGLLRRSSSLLILVIILILLSMLCNSKVKINVNRSF